MRFLRLRIVGRACKDMQEGGRITTNSDFNDGDKLTLLVRLGQRREQNSGCTFEEKCYV